MNEDIIKGKWNQIKGEAQKRWGKLTQDSVDTVEGDRVKLLGLIQESYGIAKDEAEKQISDWERSYEDKARTEDKDSKSNAA